ncbi:pyridoxal 5'-phosphate synthase [Nocardiopsis sp. HNM0947]|uniref:Pyridoxal 5'-phosphate synthase n=1 Tax=Nocardiopsis coralli TaxID=2772213 RepID=A0ABR9PE91_9ACTN|nr:pyridoxal 5'-phosphate synthase [Nocardiopsis coralli]MBE3002170.1 pyridoxal 5'-phosphate synthase [Nocardiopsis coralli]
MTNSDSIRDLLTGLPVFASGTPPFDPGGAPDDPLDLFRSWFAGAVEAGVPEPHAMVVATADGRGAPSARVLIMKDLSSRGWWFATTTTSRKGRELAQNPGTALVFHWKEQGRQVRVQGVAEYAGTGASAEDFRRRPLESRVAGLHGRQSEPLQELGEIDRIADASRERLVQEPDLAPDDWGLYVVVPHEVEFWQGDPDRRHTRLRYERTGPGDAWTRGLLWP